MSFRELPHEIIFMIATHIESENDISSLVRACRSFHNLLNNYLYERNVNRGAPALLWCAMRGLKTSVERLLKIQTRDKTENSLQQLDSFNSISSPLRAAIYYKHASIVKLLLQHGAGQTSGLPISTPLHTAVEYSSEEVVRTILEHGCNIDVTVPRAAETALVVAVRKQKPGIVKLLIKHGACLNTKPHIPAEAVEWKRHIWTTPLHTAVDGQYENREMAELLLSEGADVNVRCGDGGTSLHRTTRDMNVDDSRWLLENGADPNIIDNEENSPLHFAINLGRHGAELLELFLEHGADPNLRCRTAPTHPLELLDGMDVLEIEELLRGHGAHLPDST
ncbi:hypothetical protein N7509_000788 [Penicillium cosmopolitanum]|uniref:F-box domain-containing protein n=1 Tax=Penicillium cosmopolitanum TaxID=1131564 RepID=A0A9W9WB82_9EURO|nr:uncharacterized protein N7509_000788 [Penicillium cosmopolitanum]KAJ5414161.1 hypothetical protein N7509_000788 [Penicillium cosmopolitanum]